MPDGQLDSHPDILGFFTWFNRNLCTGRRGADDIQFVPQQRLIEYLGSEDRVTKILRALFPFGDIPCRPDAVLTRCPKVLCILLLIGKGHFIRLFHRYDSLCDKSLPIGSEAGRPKNFPTAVDDPHFFSKFYEKQWMFCVPEIHYQEDFSYRKEYILPIIHSERIKEGGSATIYRVELHEEYNKLNPRMSPLPSDTRLANTFVLKQYHGKDADKDYKNELKALAVLKRSGVPNMMDFFGSFLHGCYYNLVLEFADQGNLEEYLRDVPAPSKIEDITSFWTELFRLIDALVGMHNVQMDDEEAGQILQEWCQGVNPTNILVYGNPDLSPYMVQFKLGDPGSGDSRKVLTSGRELSDGDGCGAFAYSAPEYYRPSTSIDNLALNVNQKVDIWSLGCVFSEAAVWVVHGWEGLLTYRQQRKDSAGKAFFRDGYYFHDGYNVLPLVKETHQSLQGDMRCGDFITASVYSVMIKQMLHRDPDGRPDAKQLFHRVEEILDEATEERQRFASDLEGLENRGILPDQQGPPTPPATPDYGDLEASADGANVCQKKHKSLDSSLFQRRKPRTEKQRARFRNSTNTHPNQGYNIQSGMALFNSATAKLVGHPEPAMAPNISAEETELATSDQKPFLTVSQAAQWKSGKKCEAGFANLDSYPLLSRLEDRNYIFLIDDSSSMKLHWEELLELFSVLAYLIKKRYRDGFKVFFTIGIDKHKFNTTSEAVKVLRSKIPLGMSDISLRLGNLLSDYQKEVESYQAARIHYHTSSWARKPKPPRPTTIYILTDGAWEPGRDIETPIQTLGKQLAEAELKRRQCGIQFIQFGSDPRAASELQHLGKELKLPVDIVHTEPSTGNIWKMLFGAIDESFDCD